MSGGTDKNHGKHEFVQLMFPGKIQAQLLLTTNQEHYAWANLVRLSQRSSHKGVRQHLQMYPYCIHTMHELSPQEWKRDYTTRGSNASSAMGITFLITQSSWIKHDSISKDQWILRIVKIGRQKKLTHSKMVLHPPNIGIRCAMPWQKTVGFVTAWRNNQWWSISVHNHEGLFLAGTSQKKLLGSVGWCYVTYGQDNGHARGIFWRQDHFRQILAIHIPWLFHVMFS